MPKAYERVMELEPYRLQRHSLTRTYYVAWYDPTARQVRRRALRTKNIEEAIQTVRRLVDARVAGDPKEWLVERPIRTVAELLDHHKDYVRTLASAEAELIQIARLQQLMGERRLASLVRRDFEQFRDRCKEQNLAIATISRTLSTLRSAIKRAIENRQLAPQDAPRVPEFRTRNTIRSASPKGRLMTLDELARQLDAIDCLHLLEFEILMINTASRPGALLELTTAQFDFEHRLIKLNPPGREQTKKYRPTLPIADTLMPWLEVMPPGRVITWNAKPVDNIKRAFNSACRRADLPGGESPYSIRHMIGRHMRRCHVSSEEIAIWLGHIQPPECPETTLLYSPYEPGYLANAKRAVEDFVYELNARTKRNLLVSPRAAKQSGSS